MVYVVLGMHKSGTTLVSQILHYSGINMGEFDESLSYDKGNKYERESTWRFNEEHLDARNVNSIRISIPKDLTLTSDQQTKIREIINKLESEHETWGFKDPRTCLNYNVWKPHLPEHKIIVVYRHPFESWPRYRPKKMISRIKSPLVAWKYLKAWSAHNHNIVQYLQDTPKNNYIVLEFEALMTSDTELKRLESFVNRKLIDKRRSKLYRNKSRNNRLLKTVSWIMGKFTHYHPIGIKAQLDHLHAQSTNKQASGPEKADSPVSLQVIS